MPAEQPYLPRPGVSEQSIVEEMLRNRDAEHWRKCNEFVKRQVYIKAKNFSWSNQEDIVQDVMYKIFVYLPNFRFGCSFRTWVLLLIDHCITDRHRRLQHQERLRVVETFTEVDHEGNLPEYYSVVDNNIDADPVLAAEKRETHETVEALIETLSDTYQEVSRLYILEEMTPQQIALKLGTPLQTVRSQIRRGKAKLRDLVHPSLFKD